MPRERGRADSVREDLLGCVTNSPQEIHPGHDSLSFPRCVRVTVPRKMAAVQAHEPFAHLRAENPDVPFVDMPPVGDAVAPLCS